MRYFNVFLTSLAFTWVGTIAFAMDIECVNLKYFYVTPRAYCFDKETGGKKLQGPLVYMKDAYGNRPWAIMPIEDKKATIVPVDTQDSSDFHSLIRSDDYSLSIDPDKSRAMKSNRNERAEQWNYISGIPEGDIPARVRKSYAKYVSQYGKIIKKDKAEEKEIFGEEKKDAIWKRFDLIVPILFGNQPSFIEKILAPKNNFSCQK